MLKPKMGNVIVVLISLSMTGCGIYDKYGHGRVVSSKLDEASVTPVDMPSNAPSISQRFLPQGVSSKSEHKGFDILVPSRTPVLAATDGVVSRVQTSILYGRQVMIDHGATAAGDRIQTRYFHLSEQRVVVGDRLQRGQVIGYSGFSGLAGGFPHLHFEVHRLGDGADAVAVRFLDPQLFWVDGRGRITCYDKHREWPAEPVALSYPVPCLGMDWQ
jgi:murein DD-endopeptidase MepM/ murein hydrolase activator NlpD